MINKDITHFVTQVEDALKLTLYPDPLKEIEKIIASIYDMGYEEGNNDGFESGYEKRKFEEREPLF